MIEVLDLNIDSSYEIFNDTKDIIGQGKCYENCLRIVADRLDIAFEVGAVKIGYCYVGGEQYYLVRHCVIIDPDNKVIDPCVFFKNGFEDVKKKIENQDIKYYVFASLDRNEYINIAENIDTDLDFRKALKEQEKEVLEFIKENNLEINEKEYNILINQHIQ